MVGTDSRRTRSCGFADEQLTSNFSSATVCLLASISSLFLYNLSSRTFSFDDEPRLLFPPSQHFVALLANSSSSLASDHFGIERLLSPLGETHVIADY